jgi:hypothetical protein
MFARTSVLSPRRTRSTWHTRRSPRPFDSLAQRQLEPVCLGAAETEGVEQESAVLEHRQLRREQIAFASPVTPERSVARRAR